MLFCITIQYKSYGIHFSMFKTLEKRFQRKSRKCFTVVNFFLKKSNKKNSHTVRYIYTYVLKNDGLSYQLIFKYRTVQKLTVREILLLLV